MSEIFTREYVQARVEEEGRSAVRAMRVGRARAGRDHPGALTWLRGRFRRCRSETTPRETADGRAR